MNKIPLTALTLTVLLAACGQQSPLNAATGTTTRTTTPTVAINPAKVVTTKSGKMYVRDQLVVSLRGQSADTLAASLGGRVLDRIPELDVALIALSSGADAQQAAYDLMRSGQVRYASPMIVERHEQPVSRPAELSTQALSNQVFDQLPQYALDANHMNAKAAWDAGYTGKGVTIGVIDDPTDVSHPDLKGAWAGKAFDPTTNTEYTTTQSWIDAIDGMDGKVDNKVATDIEHGTAVASTMVATHDSTGISGVSPDAKFYTAAIFQPGFVGDFYVARAVLWSVNQGAQVLNNSWGGTGYSPLLNQAFNYALEKNVSVVVSAGNTGREDWRNPAMLPGVIASAALDINNQRAYFSTYGRHVSVAAPGVDILLASPVWINADGTRKTGNTAPGGSGYQLISGTSFSSPYTAGTAALILGARSDLDPYQVRRLMEETADGSVGSAAGYDRETGYGLIRLDKLADRLKTGTMPQKGGAARFQVQVQTQSGYVPAILADVVLEGEGPDKVIYATQTDADGYADFVAVAPGIYTVRAGVPDLSITGGDTSDRETYTGKLTVTAGTVRSTVVTTQIVFTKGQVDINPVDPYEPNDTLATAKPIAYGAPTQKAYIFGKDFDQDYFVFQGAAGDTITATIKARSTIGGQLDSFMVLRDATGKKLAFNDDTNGTDSVIDSFKLPAAGAYYLQVSSCNILCASEGEDPSKGSPDNSPFNKYILSVDKQ